MARERYRENDRQQDTLMRGLHRELDLAAQDNRMKYERPSFVVVTASRAYRTGWERIFAPQAATPGE